jgi:hypothetical protein
VHRDVRIAPWLGALLLLALAACGGDEQVVETDQGEVRVTREGEGVSVRSEEGGFEGRFGAGASLPDGFPEDVPLPDDYEVVGSMVSQEDGTMVSLQTDGSSEAALDALRRGMEEKGWTLEEDANVMGQHILSASKGERSLAVQVMQIDAGARVMMHLSPDEG